MQTVSVNVMTLCVPCENRCRYCLLSYDGKTVGANYERSKQYALKFYNWLKNNRPDLSFVFGFGYSMEHPNLLEEIKFLQSINSPTGEFLQFDGMKFRSAEELYGFLTSLKEQGIKLIDLTFYGDREYHDKFAVRKGDFDYLIEILKTANAVGLHVQVGLALTSENASQINTLVEKIASFTPQRIFLFVPHSEGRGKSLENVRFSKKDYDLLDNNAKTLLNLNKFKTESDWLRTEYIPPKKRMISFSLTDENLEELENTPFDKAISKLEKLDDEYYSVIPDFVTLAKLYGDKTCNKFYSQRDLYLKYQQRYIEENGIKVYDVNDERQSFARRF